MLSTRDRASLRGARPVAVSLLGLLLAALPAPAAEPLGNSLDWVPADVAFYSASLQLGPQYQAARESRAWKKLSSMPALQMGWAAAQVQLSQPGGPLQVGQQLLADPENRQLLDLAADMVAGEVVVFGDRSTADFLRLLIELTSTARAQGAMGRLGGNEDDPVRGPLGLLRDNVDLLTAPNLVLAFRLTDAARAERQIARLETLGRGLLTQAPQLAKRLTRERVAGVDYLTLQLDGSLLPWEQINFERYERDPGEFGELVEKLKSLTLAVSIGVRDGYLLAAIGKSNDHLARLGTGLSLAGRPELAHAAKALKKDRVVGIDYASRELRSLAATTPADVDGFRDTLVETLGQFGLPDELHERLTGDIAALADDVKAEIPEVGPAASYTVWTANGFETVARDWSEVLGLDGSRPLPLVAHLGGAPIGAYVARSKYDPRGYDLLVKWLKVAYGYADDFLLPVLDDDVQAQIREVRRVGLPLLARLDKANRELLLPALADGQSALVLDAKIKSRAWLSVMPPASAELPMLEPALVCGVSDADKLRRAAAEYFAVANEACELIEQMFPGAIPPDFRLPPPWESAVENGTLYSYPLPPIAGVDVQIAPNAGLGERVLVLSLSPRQSKAILTPTKLARPGLLADDTRPLASAGYFDCNALLDAASPWVEWGIRTALADSPAEDDAQPADGPQVAFILNTVRQGLEVLKVFRGSTSISYLEDDVLVTHTQLIIEDIP